jgi:hypothetical protein
LLHRSIGLALLGAQAGSVDFRGIEFNNLLQARWAVFFDAVGVPYRYSPWAFDFDNDTFHYAPQFIIELNRTRLWFEALPAFRLEYSFEISRALMFVSCIREIGGSVGVPTSPDSYLIAFGVPGQEAPGSGVYSVDDVGSARGMAVLTGYDRQTWAECPGCNNVGLYAGIDDELWWWKRTEVSDCCLRKMPIAADAKRSPKMLQAYLRSSNFGPKG